MPPDTVPLWVTMLWPPMPPEWSAWSARVPPAAKAGITAAATPPAAATATAVTIRLLRRFGNVVFMPMMLFSPRRPADTPCVDLLRMTTEAISVWTQSRHVMGVTSP